MGYRLAQIMECSHFWLVVVVVVVTCDDGGGRCCWQLQGAATNLYSAQDGFTGCSRIEASKTSTESTEVRAAVERLAMEASW